MNYIICASVAFSISIAVMPAVLSLSRRIGALSEIGGRHVGNLPVGRLGGLGVLAGVFFALAVAFLLYSDDVALSTNKSKSQFLGILIGVILVGGIGIWDDIVRLPARVKLSVQIFAALISYVSGLRILVIDLPLLEPFNLGWTSLPITVLWIVGVVNAINLIDGLDGLAGGVILFASLVNFVAAFLTKSIISSLLMAAVAGGILGFLMYNWHPAKIYLGDGGAYSIGFMLAISALVAPLQKASTAVAILVPILASGLPIFDTILTMLRRWLNGKNLLAPDRGHLHHLLLDAGIKHREVVIGMYLLSAFSGSIGIALLLERNKNFGIILVVLTGFALVWWGVNFKELLLKICTVKRSSGSGKKCERLDSER